MLVVAAAALLREGTGEPGTQTALRWTARCALIFWLYYRSETGRQLPDRPVLAW